MGFDLGSIIGNAAGGGVKGLLEGVGSFAKDLREAITGKTILDPNKQTELLMKAQQIEGDLAKGQQSIDALQVQIGIEEAKSGKLFIAGARPFIVWICGISIGSYFIPISVMSAIIWTRSCIEAGWKMQPYVSPFDVGQLITLTLSILGLGGYRMLEKKWGVSGDHK
ncbi:MAG: holin family protein [Gammaproteobacteria bacterium]|nr:holin family protein [Gammaproteobacteria bacterium]